MILAHAEGEGGVHPDNEFVDRTLHLGRGGIFGMGGDRLFHRVEQLLTRCFGGECFRTEAVDFAALGIHHVVVLQRALAHHEVLLFDASLSGFDRLVQPRMLKHFTFFNAEALHDA